VRRAARLSDREPVVKLFAAAALFFAVAGVPPAFAQNWGNAGPKGPRVTLNFQLSAPPAASTSPGDLTKAMASLSQSLYEIVDRQCEVLSAALKGDCRLVQININSNISDRMNNGAPSVTANANAMFEIDQTDPPKDAAPQQQ
jgi:hypothetical protein